MIRLRRLLRNDSAFFYTSFVLFFLVLFCIRLFVVDYFAYRNATRDQVVEFLNARNFPQREETHEAILAAVLSLRESESDSAEEAHARECKSLTVQNELHEAIKEIWRQAAAESPSLDQRWGIHSVYDRLSEGSSIQASVWVDNVIGRIQRFQDNNDNTEIVPCPDSTRCRLGFLYGKEGCDPDSVGSKTELQVPPFLNIGRSNPIPSDKEQSDEADAIPAIRYPARVYNANDLSLVLDDVLNLVRLDSVNQDSDEHILHQIYFISPDGLLRYWSSDRMPPSERFTTVTSWLTSPFIQEPLKYIADNGKDMSSAKLAEGLQKHLDDVLGVPYIDFGSFGLVRTKTTPLISPNGTLVGVFCTDVSLPLMAAGGKTSDPATKILRSDATYFRWGLVELVDPKGRCLLEPLDGWERSQEWLKEIPELQVRVREAAAKKGDEFLQMVQAINIEPLENTLFVIPLQTTKHGRIVMLLLPQAPVLPWKTQAMAVGACIAFLAALLLRRAYEDSARPQQREATILRDLNAGAINVNSDGVILEGNDRAEEVLGTRLPNFGVAHDLADQQSLFDLLHETVLYAGPPKKSGDSSSLTYKAMSLTQVQEDRFEGLAYPFYAKLKSPSESAKDHGSYGNVSAWWVRCKGIPVLGGERAGARKRSVTVVHTVKTHRADELEGSWPDADPGVDAPEAETHEDEVKA